MERMRRHTRQLEVIWEAIKNDVSHPTADQVYEKVRAIVPHISLGTVYRNLQKLVEEGRLQVVTIDRTQHFDPLTAQHQHFICEKCSRVYDLFLNREEILPAPLPPDGFTITSHQLALYGTCKRCSRGGTEA